MNLPLATLVVALIAVFGNRIFAVLAGLWLRLPAVLMLGLLIALDFLQIPFFYWVYDHGSAIAARLPEGLRIRWARNRSASYLGKWAASLGGMGVMMVAALPTLGGGMWSGTFIAYGLGLRRRVSYVWLALGSLLSYLILYWALGTLVSVVRYFSH